MPWVRNWRCIICCGRWEKRRRSTIRTERLKIISFLTAVTGSSMNFPPSEPFDAAFILDCSELERVGKEAEKIAAIPHLVNIDHHYSNGGSARPV